MSKTFFTSDTHFGHKNILKYDGRPFSTIEEHDETLIKNWNSVVSDEDTIYFLGDFAFNSSKKNDEEIMKQLNGNKFFIKGNHDHRDTRKLYEKYGTYMGKLDEITIDNQLIALCHFSMRVWEKSHRGAFHLYGHSHGSLPDDPNSLSFDVGIMNHDYYPIDFERVKEIMATKTWKPVDHHK